MSRWSGLSPVKYILDLNLYFHSVFIPELRHFETPEQRREVLRRYSVSVLNGPVINTCPVFVCFIVRITYRSMLFRRLSPFKQFQVCVIREK